MPRRPPPSRVRVRTGQARGGGAKRRAEPAAPSFGRAELALMLFFASPAVIVPGGLERFVFGKTLVAAIAVLVASLAASSERLTRSAAILIGSGASLLVLAAGISAAPAAGLLGRSPRYEGVFVLAVYALTAVCGAKLLGEGVRTQFRVTVVIRTMAVVAVLVALIAVLEAFGLRPLSTNLDRPGSLLGNASDQGAFGVLYAGPLLCAAIRRRADSWAWAGTAASLTSVVLSASRGALLGVAVAVFVAAVVVAGRYRLHVLAAGALVAAGALAVPFTRDRVLGTSPLAGQTVSGRDLLWRETLSLYTHHPALGIGPNNFTVAIVGQHDRAWQEQVGPANPPDSPHNWLLQALDAGGPVLLGIAIGLVVLAIRALWQRRADAWSAGSLAGLAGYGVALLFHLTAPGTTIPAALLGGAALAAPARRAAIRWWDWASALVAAALVVVFAAAAASELVLKHASQQLADGNLTAAQANFETVRNLRPWDVDLPALVAHEFVSVGSPPDGSLAARARGYASRWLARTSSIAQDEQVVEDRALVLEGNGYFRAALKLIESKLAEDRYNPLLLIRRGVLEAELKEYADAQRSFRTAAAISRSSPEPWDDLATLYGIEGKTALQRAAKDKADALRN